MPIYSRSMGCPPLTARSMRFGRPHYLRRRDEGRPFHLIRGGFTGPDRRASKGASSLTRLQHPEPTPAVFHVVEPEPGSEYAPGRVEPSHAWPTDRARVRPANRDLPTSNSELPRHASGSGF